MDTVTTDENGNSESKALYLGKYTVRETKAPYGMVLNGTEKTVELTYAGETVEVTETSAEFYNARQKAALSLAKILGKDETFVPLETGTAALTYKLTKTLNLHVGDTVRVYLPGADAPMWTCPQLRQIQTTGASF